MEEFSKQKRTIYELAARAAKIFKKNKTEIGKVANFVYTALEKDVENIAKDVIFHIKELAKAKYGIVVLPWKVPKDVVTRPEFCFCFLESLNAVVDAHRVMDQKGMVFPCIFSYFEHIKKKKGSLEDWIDPGEAKWIEAPKAKESGTDDESV